MEIFPILLIPLALAGIAVLPGVKAGRSRKFGVLNAAGHSTNAVLAVLFALGLLRSGEPASFFGFFYADLLSAFFILTISVINSISALYSIGYISADVKDGVMSERKAKAYYALFNLFALSMLCVPVVSNLGMVWVAIEMTTLVSAFLVGFYNKKESIEAAWKYIIICSVGITLALLGTILFYYTASRDGGVSSLNWTDMAAVAGSLNPSILKVAFLFILVGYGTKAGFVPMHTWLPDAHSQALAPISAMLSGVLLPTAIYAIIRFATITNVCIGTGYAGNLFMLFGLVSLGIGAGFVLVQRDIKRLLAYSSVENIGIIAAGLGFGGTVAIYGALFHVFNHAAAKSLMFFAAGRAVKKYKSHNIREIRGIISAMPFAGTMLIIGVFALTGSPPFSAFFSEIMILLAGFKMGLWPQAALLLLFMAIAFGAIVLNISRPVFGGKPEGMPVEGEPLSGKLAFGILLLLICVMGLAAPGFFRDLLLAASEIIRGA